MTITYRRCFATLLLVGGVHLSSASQTAQFGFGSNQNSLPASSTVSLADGGVTLGMTVGPYLGQFDESSSKGLGVNTSNVLYADPNPNKFNLVPGAGEFVDLWFDKPVVITGIDFDGVKDEALEYFILTTPSGQRINFFDSAANLSVPGAVGAAVDAGEVTGTVVYLLEDATFDDEIIDAQYRLAAGEVARLTYAELGPAFNPSEPGNGARLEGLTVTVLPEPSSLLLMALVFSSAATRNRTPSQAI